MGISTMRLPELMLMKRLSSKIINPINLKIYNFNSNNINNNYLMNSSKKNIIRRFINYRPKSKAKKYLKVLSKNSSSKLIKI